MKPIYKPNGRAEEYCELAVNIYTGCPHGCTYCYAAKDAKRWGRDFTDVRPREGIVEAVKRQLRGGKLKDQTIHLCFTCDPYPKGYDTIPTRKVIEAIKNCGNHVQILTKNGKDAQRDFDLLDSCDWFGVTLTGNVENEPGAGDTMSRIGALLSAKHFGIKTWASFEPVFNPEYVYNSICVGEDLIDMYRIGMLNHYASDINWAEFGRECERLCQLHKCNYYIKADLRAEMVKGGDDAAES